MNKVGKIIIGVVVVAAIVGGGYFFLNKGDKTVSLSGQKITLVKGDKSIKLDLPKEDQLNESSAAVMGFLNLTEEQQNKKMEQEQKKMDAIEKGEEVKENPEDEINETITGENYDVIKDQSINEISINLKNGITVRYQLLDTTYTKDILESIAEGTKDAKFGNVDFMYTVQHQNDYYFYYMVCNKLEENSIFVVLTSTKELQEKDLIQYMNAIKF